MKKNRLYLVIVILLAIVAVVVIKTKKHSPSEAELTYTVKKGTLDLYIYATGSLEAEQSTNINAPSSIFDRKLRIWEINITDMVEEGTVVDSGQYIASLDQNMIQEKLVAAEEELELAYNNLEDAMLDSSLTLSNQRDAIISAQETLEETELILAESKYESPATIQKSKMDKAKAIRKLAQEEQSYELEKRKVKTKVQQKQLDYDRKLKSTEGLKKVLEDIVIMAPQRGMVIYYSERDEIRTVGSSVSSYSPIIATLPDLSTMISKAYVNEIDISNVRVGQKVELSVDAFSDKVLQGKVIYVANIGKTVSGSDAKVFEVTIKVLSKDSKLRPAMTTNNTIHTGSFSDTIIVPSETVFSNDSMDFVYVTGSQKYKQIIKLGEQSDNFAIIEEGLQPGDVIQWVAPDDAEQLEFKGWDVYETIKTQKADAQKKADKEAKKMGEDKSRYNATQKKSGGGSVVRIMR